jgi:two-component system sensor histidine kinase FlrB
LTDTLKQVNPAELEQAFSLFTEASAQLTGAYHDLQQQVERLTGELAVANSELRRQLEEKAALSQRLKLLLDALPAGVVVLDRDGCVVEANPAAQRLLGEIPLATRWDDLAGQLFKPSDTPQEWELATGRLVNLVSSPFDASGGRIVLLSDITEAHELQRQLERHQRLSSMGEMAASLAHQLRTPLATALLYTANLTKKNLGDDDRVRFAEKSLARLKHLEQLIQDMLLFVRGGSVAEEEVLVSSLLVELSQTIEPQLHQHGIVFEVKDNAGGVMLAGSRKALTGALLNLLENAMQACAAGGAIQLDAKQVADDIVISVSDSGRGMDAATQERLFQPFFTTRIEGTGLGLAIVRGVVETHGGRIEVESELGKGSRFSIWLPKIKQ